jgi:VWFA-related protein
MHPIRRIGSFLLPFLFCTVITSAQQVQPAPAGPQSQNGQQSFTLRIDTQLVVETVQVKDKDGKTIEGLTKDDFNVLEDNVPQSISVFEFQRLDDVPIQTRVEAGVTPKTTVEAVKPTQITPPPKGDARYQDRRLMVLFFDLSNISQADALRSFLSADKFIRTQMTPADLVALMVFHNGAVSVLQDFTDNRPALYEVMQKLMYPDDNTNDTDVAGAFGQDSGEFNIFNTDRQLAALQTAVNMLRIIPEKKSLVYFASGLRLNGTDNQAQLVATTNAANRANVTFFPVDARGLVAMAPLGDASRASPGGIGMFNGQTAGSLMTGFQRSQDSLYTLAADTGGKAMLDNNDLGAGIVQAQKSITSYYVIGYYSTNTNQDGKLRKIKISLKDNVSAKMDFRQAYFGPKTFNRFTAADKERQLEEALMLGDPITDLTIDMEVNYFQLNRAEYFVPVSLKIPGSELALARSGGNERTVIDFIGEIKDDFGGTIQNLRDKVDVKLSGETASQLATHPIEYDTGFTLLPGKYVIKVLARDDETGRIGTYQRPFEVPNLLKEDKKIPISSVVLSSQRVDMKEAIFNATKDKSAAAQLANPLVQDGQKLVPSVTRVFSKSRELYVYLQAYERAAATTEPLVAFVTFYRGQTKAFETAPLAVVDGLDPKSKAVPLRFSLSLGKLQPGEYNCQVSVLDPAGKKVAFWQAPIMLVP